MENSPTSNFKKEIKNLDVDTNPPHEGKVTKAVENVTSRVPSIGYLTLALGSLVASASIALFTRKKDLANFIGLWVPSIMIAGIYNKLVKLEGSDRFSHKDYLH